MITSNDSAAEAAVWGPYASYQDIARFQYGRILWKRPLMRARLLAHWTDQRHPYRERFAEQRVAIEDLLASDKSPVALDCELRASGQSLRALAREIPPVFGSFFAESRSAVPAL